MVILNKEKAIELINKCEDNLQDIFKDLDNNEFVFSRKVLEAFHAENLQESDFSSTTGYGYNDIGRDKIERIFARVLGSEDALVRNQFISGTHALTVTLFGLLRPGDVLLSISGTPYDTLHEVIGLKDNPSSLKSFGIKYDQIDLVNHDFNYEEISKYLKEHQVKVIEIQRSKGYSTRKSINIEKIAKVVKLIKEINSDIIIMVDNCYCEFVEIKTPCEVGADIMVGSLIKNLGGGIAQNGAYVAGRKDLVNLVSERLTVPGEGKEVGPTLGVNKSILQGLYFAPSVVTSSLKFVTLTSKVLEELGYKVEPRYNEKRVDIVENIEFGNPTSLINFCASIQASSAVDAAFIPEPTDMPGYDNQIIMASGSFTQGSSIELSCDGPIREPYIAYLQGSLTYQYGKLALINAVLKLLNAN